jgi:nicotinate phosphoribosyltransferase
MFNDQSVFDLFFRKNPFHGEFCIFAGTDEILRFVASYKFSLSDIEYLKSIMPTCDPKFFEWLITLDCSNVKVYTMEEGTVTNSLLFHFLLILFYEKFCFRQYFLESL